eukprot:758797-Hanusia_phi.AAC.3
MSGKKRATVKDLMADGRERRGEEGRQTDTGDTKERGGEGASSELDGSGVRKDMSQDEQCSVRMAKEKVTMLCPEEIPANTRYSVCPSYL